MVLKENLEQLLLSPNVLECIIVDDNNIPLEELSQIRHLNNKVKILNNNKNLGASEARNRGAKEAAGKFLFFCDADVVLNSKSFDEAVAFMLNRKLELLQGQYLAKLRWNNGPSTYKHCWQLINISQIKEGPTPIVGTSLFIIKKNLFLEKGGFHPLQDVRASVEDRLFGVSLKKSGHLNYFYPPFCGEHVHFYNLDELIQQTFWRAVDEVFYLTELSQNFNYNSPKKLACLLMFSLGLVLLAFSPLVALILIILSMALETYFLSRKARTFHLSWMWISCFYNLSVIAGAVIGFYRLVKKSLKS